MKPWHIFEFQLEEKFEHIVLLYNKNKDIELEQVGSCLISMITLCQDIDQIDIEEEQQKFWLSIKPDIDELLIATDDFLKTK